MIRLDSYRRQRPVTCPMGHGAEHAAFRQQNCLPAPQIGFVSIEAGAGRAKNVRNILLKVP